MKEIRVVIAGGRDFNDYNLLKTNVSNILSNHLKNKDNIVIISGTARGADTLGEKFAKENEIKVKQFPANWNLFGKRAGYIRNKQMAEYAVEDNNMGILIAFWDGVSKGTGHMINLARENGLEVHIVRY